MALTFTWVNVFIFFAVVAVLVALSIFRKITEPIRIVMTILSFVAFLWFIWSSGLGAFGLEKVLFMGQGTADLFSALVNLLIGRVTKGG